MKLYWMLAHICKIIVAYWRGTFWPGLLTFRQDFGAGSQHRDTPPAPYSFGTNLKGVRLGQLPLWQYGVLHCLSDAEFQLSLGGNLHGFPRCRISTFTSLPLGTD